MREMGWNGFNLLLFYKYIYLKILPMTRDLQFTFCPLSSKYSHKSLPQGWNHRETAFATPRHSLFMLEHLEQTQFNVRSFWHCHSIFFQKSRKTGSPSSNHVKWLCFWCQNTFTVIHTPMLTLVTLWSHTVAITPGTDSLPHAH